MKFALRVLIASVVLLLAGVVHHPSLGGAASALLVCTVLCWITERSRATGAELLVALAGFYFILVSVCTIPEGVLFDVIKVGQAPLIMARQLGIAVVIACVIAILFGRTGAAPAATPAPAAGLTVVGLLWRLAAAAAVFNFCYFAAGMLIFPLVKSYYAARVIPGPGTIAAAQVLRAMVLILAGWLVLRIVPEHRDARLILTTAFPVIGVISLMLPPNEIMPPEVRWVHALEVTPYYALFGLLLAVWFGPPHATPAESVKSRLDHSDATLAD